MAKSQCIGLSALVFAIAASVSVSALAWEQGQNMQSADQEVVVRGRLPDRDTVSRAVYIGDLNLATPDGVGDMEKRVGNAIDWICEIPAVVGYYKNAAERPCREEGWASARPQMDRAIQLARASSASR